MNILKKSIIISAVALAFSGALFAEGGYNIGLGNTDSNNAFVLQGGYGGAYMQAVKDATLTFDVSKLASNASNVKFGVYTFDGNKNVISETVFDNVNINDVFSVDFKEGDYVGFWIEGNGMAGDSLIGKSYMGTLNPDGTFNLNFNLDSNAWNDWWNTMIGVSGGASSPSGQPLPGVLATLALAAALGVPLRKKLSA